MEKRISVGILKEIKANEGRVILSPQDAAKLNRAFFGHVDILVQKDAGLLSGYQTDEYEEEGAKIIPEAEELWSRSDLILKVKEPLPGEMALARKDQYIMAFFHLPALKYVLPVAKEKNLKLILMERLSDQDGKDPLAAMSEIAGLRAVDFAAEGLVKSKGMLLRDAEVIIIGSEGIVGQAARNELVGRSTKKIICVDKKFQRPPPGVMYQSKRSPSYISCADECLGSEYAFADAVILCAKIKNGPAPKIIDKNEFGFLKPGTVIVDVSIDEGGNCVYSKPTPISRAPYEVKGVLIYAVPNMPGSVPRSSTPRLSSAILPFVQKAVEAIRNQKWPKELKEAIIEY